MKQLLNPANAAFDHTAGTITFSTTIPSTISHILHITNITRGVLYFQPQGGVQYSGTYASPVLTLNADTSAHADADKLEIFYDDGLTTQAVTGGLTDTELRASPVPVSASSLPLPSGASTEATLALIKAKTDNIDVALSTRTKPADQQHVIVDSSASVAVTGPLTDTQLRATPVPVSGTVTASSACTIADGADVTLGAKADAKSAATDTTPITAMSVLKQISASVQAPPSQAVTNAGTFAVQATCTNAGTFAVQDSGVVSALGSPFQAGGSIGNTSFTVTQGTGTNLHTVVDSGTITTVSTVTSVTSITNTVTTKELRTASAATTQVADTASSTTLLSANGNRLGGSITNDSSARLFIKAGTTASTTDYTVPLSQWEMWEIPFGYTGRIDGIWATDPNDGAARITEYS